MTRVVRRAGPQRPRRRSRRTWGFQTWRWDFFHFLEKYSKQRKLHFRQSFSLWYLLLLSRWHCHTICSIENFLLQVGTPPPTASGNPADIECIDLEWTGLESPFTPNYVNFVNFSVCLEIPPLFVKGVINDCDFSDKGKSRKLFSWIGVKQHIGRLKHPPEVPQIVDQGTTFSITTVWSTSAADIFFTNYPTDSLVLHPSPMQWKSTRLYPKLCVLFLFEEGYVQ